AAKAKASPVAHTATATNRRTWRSIAGLIGAFIMTFEVVRQLFGNRRATGQAARKRLHGSLGRLAAFRRVADEIAVVARDIGGRPDRIESLQVSLCNEA